MTMVVLFYKGPVLSVFETLLRRLHSQSTVQREREIKCKQTCVCVCLKTTVPS